MRTIKYRVWHKFKKEMLPVTGLEFRDGDLSRIVADVEGVLDFMPDEDVLMQFTGLLDGEDHEIYEGDVVKYCLHSGAENARVGTVTYNSGSFMLDAATHLSTGMYREVIGNIYEHPILASKLRE